MQDRATGKIRIFAHIHEDNLKEKPIAKIHHTGFLAMSKK